MELRHFRYFVAVAEALNFTRAAERLHTSQPSLSQQIRQLEAELGLVLFDRTRRSVRLTEAGTVFLAEATAALSRVDQAIATTRGVQAGTRRLVVGFLMSVEGNLLHRLLPEVQRRMPEQTIELRCMTTPEQVARLLAGDIDVGFLRLPQNDGRLRYDKLLEEPIHLVVPEGHPLARHVSIPPLCLDGVPCIGAAEPEAGTLQGVINRWAKKLGIRLTVTEQAGTVTGYMALVRLGRGVGLLPEFAATMLLPGLVHRPIVDGPRIGLAMASLAAQQQLVVTRFTGIVKQLHLGLD